MFARVVAPLTLCAALSPALADEVVTADATHEGVYVGIEGDTLLLLTDRGEVEIPRDQIVEHRRADVDDDRLRRRGERARERHVARRQREVERLLRDLGRADTPSQRAPLEAALADYDVDELSEPLEDALDDRHDHVRAAAIRALATLPDATAEQRVYPLVRAVMTSDRLDVVDAAHTAAVEVDRSLARRVYEGVAASDTHYLRRVRALRQLHVLADPASVPGVIAALETVNNQLRATQVQSGGIERVPVDLGTNSGAAISAPIELPTAQTTEVGSSITAQFARYTRVRNAAVAALRTLTGQDHGADPDAWRRAWDAAQPPAQGRQN